MNKFKQNTVAFGTIMILNLAGPSPAQASEGDYSAHIRGRIQVDAVTFKEEEGGRDYNSGMAFRRARVGVYGNISRDFKYQVLVDFADGKNIKLDDNYIQYTGWQLARITMGQHKVYHSLDSATSDIYVPFMERSMVSNAFEAGAGAKLGLSAFSHGDNWTMHVGFMTDSADKASRNTDGWGVNSRMTFAPLLEKRKAIHFGTSFYYREESEGHIRFADRPEIRVDNTKLVDSGLVNADAYTVLGLEAAGVWGPVSVQADFNRADVKGLGEAPGKSFWGISAAATYMLTGEDRNYQGESGAFGRIRPDKPLGGGAGAWQLAARYSYLDLEDQGQGNRMKNLTLALNWIPTDHTRIQINYIHFDADCGGEDRGHAIGLRAQADW